MNGRSLTFRMIWHLLKKPVTVVKLTLMVSFRRSLFLSLTMLTLLFNHPFTHFALLMQSDMAFKSNDICFDCRLSFNVYW